LQQRGLELVFQPLTGVALAFHHLGKRRPTPLAPGNRFQKSSTRIAAPADFPACYRMT
jgi:hypothetical protein